MIIFIALAVGAGLLIGLSRQLNGRLALSTNAMESSFWNHIVGLVFVSIIALFIGGMFDGAPLDAPWWVDVDVEQWLETSSFYFWVYFAGPCVRMHQVGETLV